MSKALAIDFSTSNTGYAFRNPLTNEYVVGSIAGGKSKDPLERAKLIADGITEIIEHYNLFDYFIFFEEPIITFKSKGNISLIRANGSFLGVMRNRHNIGYVDSVKVANSTEKGIEITKEINAKKAELDAKIAAADEASKQNVFNQANQELNAFANAKAQEYRQYQEQKVGELVKEKKLDVVIEKGAVVGGGSDVTDDLIAKMGKASADQIKEAENAAKAQEQQDAQQNAQQTGQTTAVNTEESAQ